MRFQEQLWRQVQSVAAKDAAMVPTGLYIQALNEMFDAQQSRLTALRNRVPDIVLWALYGIAVVGIGYAGYASGIERRRWRLPVYTMSVLAASVILLIQDLDRPTSGFISVDQQPMVDTAKAVAGYWAELRRPRPHDRREKQSGPGAARRSDRDAAFGRGGLTRGVRSKLASPQVEGRGPEFSAHSASKMPP